MRTHLGFGLYDVILKGKLEQKPDTLFMSELVDFAKENNKELFLITGLDRDKGEEIIKRNGIDAYFSEKNIHYIEKSYYETLSDIDKEIKEQAKEKDPNYSDEYYKVYFFNSVYGGPKEKTLFVGHDVWTDAYYLSKYASIDVILLKNTISNNYAPHLVEIKELHIIDPTIEAFKEYLETEKQFNYAPLHNYASKLLYKEMMANNLFNTNLTVGSVWNRHREKMSFRKGEDD